jgi:hypothetical protein
MGIGRARQERRSTSDLLLVYVEGNHSLVFIYPKNVQENLTQDQLKQLKRIIEEEYHEG